MSDKKKKKGKKCFQPISKIIFTNHEIFVKHLVRRLLGRQQSTVTGVKTSLSWEVYNRWLLSNIIFTECLRNEFRTHILIDWNNHWKKRESSTRDVTHECIFRIDKHTRFYTCILNTCATYLCIRWGIKYFMA